MAEVRSNQGIEEYLRERPLTEMVSRRFMRPEPVRENVTITIQVTTPSFRTTEFGQVEPSLPKRHPIAYLPSTVGRVTHSGTTSITSGSTEKTGGSQMEPSNKLENKNGILEYSIALNRLLEIADATHEDYDDEFLPPHLTVVTNTAKLLKSAKESLSNSFPKTLIFPDGRGGVSVEWRRDNSVVNLRVSHSGAKLFHSFNGVPQIEDASESNTVKWLSRLVSPKGAGFEFTATI